MGEQNNDEYTIDDGTSTKIAKTNGRTKPSLRRQKALANRSRSRGLLLQVTKESSNRLPSCCRPRRLRNFIDMITQAINAALAEIDDAARKLGAFAGKFTI